LIISQLPVPEFPYVANRRKGESSGFVCSTLTCIVARSVSGTTFASVYIPKADGRQRPLGIAALEDKIVQQAVVTILNEIYEVVSGRVSEAAGEVRAGGSSGEGRANATPTQEQMADVKAGEQSLLFYGQITYTEVFGEQHEAPIMRASALHWALYAPVCRCAPADLSCDWLGR
jgi:hypothetical protein